MGDPIIRPPALGHGKRQWTSAPVSCNSRCYDSASALGPERSRSVMRALTLRTSRQQQGPAPCADAELVWSRRGWSAREER
eukprot:2948566-Alexandrium_andersonii.AAC.1